MARLFHLLVYKPNINIMNYLRKATKEERKFLGVCGGISRFIDPEMDPFIVRLSTVILSLLWPPMIFVYFISAIFLKTHDSPFDRAKWIANYAEKYGLDLNDFKKEEPEDSKE